jgi:Questin oxidase-like
MSSYADALGDALERLADLGYERGGDGGDLANHGPMAAEALACMGLNGEVALWAERYKRNSQHYAPPQPRSAIDPLEESSWRSALGQIDRAGDWERLFEIQLQEQPWQTVLARWWPRLLPGLLASLTHGLIRTAHAVRSVAHDDKPTDIQLRELARGLAFWAARFTGLPGEVRMTGSLSIAEAVAALPRLPADLATEPLQPGQSVERLYARRQLATLEHGEQPPGYHAGLSSLAPQRVQQLLSEMTSTFAGVYVAHWEVSPVPLVHGVTAPAAIRLVLPHLPHQLHMPTVAAIWKVHMALLLAFTHDQRAEQGDRSANLDTNLPNREELINHAYEHGAEHVIKLVEACLRENALSPDPRYAAATRAALQRISTLQP